MRQIDGNCAKVVTLEIEKKALLKLLLWKRNRDNRIAD